MSFPHWTSKRESQQKQRHHLCFYKSALPSPPYTSEPCHSQRMLRWSKTQIQKSLTTAVSLADRVLGVWPSGFGIGFSVSAAMAGKNEERDQEYFIETDDEDDVEESRNGKISRTSSSSESRSSNGDYSNPHTFTSQQWPQSFKLVLLILFYIFNLWSVVL